MLIFIVSLSVEIIQGIFGIGAVDIDDIILNISGGLIGILLYKYFLIVLRDEDKVRILISIASIIGLPILLWLLFMVRLKL